MHAAGRQDPRKGFSLVEIVIALAIFGILLVVAVTTFRGLNEKYRVETETKQLYADLMDARARAMQRNRISFVRFSAGGSGYATYLDTPPAGLPEGNGSFDATDTTLTSVTGTHPMSVSLAGGATSFEFNGGGIASTSGTVSLGSTEQPDYDCITIGPTRIKMGAISGGTCVEK